MKNAIAIMTLALFFITAIALRHSGFVPGWIVNIVFFAAGIYTYIESFHQYRKLRFIRDTATSKIGSLPMGLVEVYGQARCLPGLFDIYRYLSVKEILCDGKIDILSLFGITSKETLSARPFYIEDGTGAVFIDPLHAEMIIDCKSWKEGDYLYREAEIKEGDYIYCIGTAQRKESVDIVEGINKAIREAKKSKDTVIRFDTNSDGKISFDEWAVARKTIESEVINKNINNSSVSIININKGKDNTIFIISNKKEHFLIKKYYIRILILLFIGITMTVYSLIATFSG